MIAVIIIVAVVTVAVVTVIIVIVVTVIITIMTIMRAHHAVWLQQPYFSLGTTRKGPPCPEPASDPGLQAPLQLRAALLSL